MLKVQGIDHIDLAVKDVGALLAIICVVALSPIMIEASINTRSLSGPGKNPEGTRLD